MTLTLAGALCASAAPNLFTYQGRLKEGGLAVNGNRTVEIFLCDAGASGAGNCTTTTAQPVTVTNGLFRSTFTIPASLDLGTGNWWLEIKIGANTLEPREQLTSNAYALFAATAAYAEGLSAAPGSEGVYISSNLYVSGGAFTVGSRLMVSTHGVLAVGDFAGVSVDTNTALHVIGLTTDAQPGIEDARVAFFADGRSSGSGAEDIVAAGNNEVTLNGADSAAIAVALRAKIRRENAGAGVVDRAIGLMVDDINNSGGTLTNTYGVFIGDQSDGGQTNVAYSLYAQDPNARSYFAGLVGISSATPSAALVISSAAGSAERMLIISTGSSEIFSVKGNGEVYTAGKFIGDGSGLTNISVAGDNLGDHTATQVLRMGAYGVNTSSHVNAAAYQINGSTVLALRGTGGSIYNVAVGRDAGRNDVGSSNVFVGSFSGQTTVGAVGVTYVGDSAGLNSSGSVNTFVGAVAGKFNTTGDKNVAMGQATMYRTQAGSANTVLGTEAGYGVASNSFSSATLVGYRAGYGLSTGDGNILLGYRAGYGVTSGTGNIVIGYDAGTSAPAANNELNIGGLLYGDLAAKVIGVSTRAPQAALDVVSTGTLSDQYAQIWRDSGGAIISSMSSTGVLKAGKFVGDGSGITNIAVSGDNLGNHTATQNLGMGGFDINSASQLTVSSVTGPGTAYIYLNQNAALPTSKLAIGRPNSTANYPLAVYADNPGGIAPVLHIENKTANSGSGTEVIFSANGAVHGRLQVVDESSIGSTSMRLTTFSGEVLRLHGARAGVGSADPDQKLTVAGNISQTGVLISSGTGKNYFAGSVGIGTNNPGYKLHLYDTAGLLGALESNSASNVQFLLKNSVNEWSLLNDGGDASKFKILLTGSPKLTISGDSVGIGTQSPNYRLDVQGGSINASASLCIADNCKSSWASVDNLGNHTATQDLDLAQNDILNVSSMTIYGRGMLIGTDLGGTGGGIFISTGGAIQTVGVGHGTQDGNPRGLGAVDLQTTRQVAAHVASGRHSTIGGGYWNKASGNYSVVPGGYANAATGLASAVSGGDFNIAAGDYSAVSGGLKNRANALYSFIGGGAPYGGVTGNIVDADYGAIVGGSSNTITTNGWMSAIVGGSENTANAQQVFIGGGWMNTAGKSTKYYSGVVAGYSNRSIGDSSFVGAGGNNVASGDNSVVPGGSYNTASGAYSFAAGYRSSSTASGAFTWSDSQGTLAENGTADRTLFKNRGGFLVTGSTNTNMTSGLLDRGMFVSGGGLVGIATGAPQAALDVVSNGQLMVPAQIWRDSGGAIVSSMSPTGNLTATSQILKRSGDGYMQRLIVSGGGSWDAGIRWDGPSVFSLGAIKVKDMGYGAVQAMYGGDMIFETDPGAYDESLVERMRIGFAGGVSMGSPATEFPQAALDVKSTATAYNYNAQVWRNSSGVVVATMTSEGVLQSQSFKAVYGPISNSILTEQTLLAYTLPANTLYADGKGVRISAWGKTAANANVKTIRLKFGVTPVVVNSLSPSPNNLNWHFEAKVYRSGASAQKYVGTGTVGAVAEAVTNGASLETDTGAISILLTGLAPTATGDITVEGMTIEVFN